MICEKVGSQLCARMCNVIALNVDGLLSHDHRNEFPDPELQRRYEVRNPKKESEDFPSMRLSALYLQTKIFEIWYELLY